MAATARIETDVHGRSDIGHRRKTNQDRFLIADLKRQMAVCESNLDMLEDTSLVGNTPGKLLVLADGVGGHAGGETASTLAVETIADYVLNSMHRFLKLAEERDEEFRDELAAGMEACQRRLAREQHHHPELAEMGTTLTLAYIVWPQMYVVHVGDSRAYVLRDGTLRQLTKDHTVAQQFVDGGAMSREDVPGSPWRHVIWNCLAGSGKTVAPEVTRFELHHRDLVLLCSDGLTDRLSDDKIIGVLSQNASAQMLTEALIDAANDEGGDDNITAIVARFPFAPSPAETCGSNSDQQVIGSLTDTDPELDLNFLTDRSRSRTTYSRYKTSPTSRNPHAP